MKLKELFKDETCWTQKTYARNKDGHKVGPDEKSAICWSVYGAIIKCYPNQEAEIMGNICAELNVRSVSEWDDAPERKFQDVKNLVEKLDI